MADYTRTQNPPPVAAIRDHWQWKVKYSRCFTFPSSYHSNTTFPPTLSPLKVRSFKPIWLTGSEDSSSNVSLLPSADGSSFDNFIVTVNFQGTLIEEHFVSKLHFSWPHVSCVSGFGGSRVVFASYIDSANEKQKFALQFSTISETEDFITSLENIFSNKIPKVLPSANTTPTLSCESEVAAPYRPDMTNVMSPTYASPVPSYSYNEEFQGFHAQDKMGDHESNGSSFPRRFTSLVSNCYAKGSSVQALPSESKNLDLRSQIVKYMQDSSFLDIVSKVNEVITELGEDFVLEMA